MGARSLCQNLPTIGKWRPMWDSLYHDFGTFTQYGKLSKMLLTLWCVHCTIANTKVERCWGLCNMSKILHTIMVLANLIFVTILSGSWKSDKRKDDCRLQDVSCWFICERLWKFVERHRPLLGSRRKTGDHDGELDRLYKYDDSYKHHWKVLDSFLLFCGIQSY